MTTLPNTRTPSPALLRSRTARPLVGKVMVSSPRPTWSALAPAAPHRSTLDELGEPISPVQTNSPAMIEHHDNSNQATVGLLSLDAPLSDMVDRASAQLVILRRTLDEASRVAQTTRQQSAEIARRLEQGRGFTAEFDLRLASANESAGLLGKAVETLRGLEQLASQIRGMSSALEERMSARLQEQEAAFERRLIALSAQCEERLTQVQNRQATIDHEIAEMGRGIDRSLKLESDRLSAEIDRRSAQVQARVSLMLDSASDRVQTMEAQVERLGGVVTERVNTLCQQAAFVLGNDPRNPTQGEPKAGSLSERLLALDEKLRHADDATLRLSATLSQSAIAVERTDTARAAVEALVPTIDTSAERASAASEAANARLQQFSASLERAEAQHAEALERMASADRSLTTLREDLTTMSSAVGYHITQAKEAQNSLAELCERASAGARTLESGLEQVTLQASELVGLARDAAGLIAQAQAKMPTSAVTTTQSASKDAA